MRGNYLSTTIEPHPGYLKLNEQCKRELGDHDLPHRGEAWSRQRQGFLSYLAMK